VVRLGDLIAVVDEWFDPRWAESWDAVGLVCGDPEQPVERVLLAVDAVPATAREAVDSGAQLLLTHHPLLLTPVHSVATTSPKGDLVHGMIRSGIAHFVAHTNADVADPGVSDALAARLGLQDTCPLLPQDGEALDKLVVFVPAASAESLVDALAAAGAGAIGDYDRCAWTTQGVGTFRPGSLANPAIGRPGVIETVDETRVEMVLPSRRRAPVVAALRAAHPYEEPAFDLLVQAPVPSTRGPGRLGRMPAPMALGEFTAHVARSLPATAWGVRAAGDPSAPVQTVAVCGGSGGSYAELARQLGADAFVTSDLKHHTTLEAVGERADIGMALVDAAHWATEAPWLDAVAARLREHFGTTVDVRVSQRVTDPWTLHCPSPRDPSTGGASPHTPSPETETSPIRT
jgi:dinuclear metal center YbgI/SA1388 family protein